MYRVKNTRTRAAVARQNSNPLNAPERRVTRSRRSPNNAPETTVNIPPETIATSPSSGASTSSENPLTIPPSPINTLVQHNFPPPSDYSSTNTFPTQSYLDLKTAIHQIPEFHGDNDERCTLSNFIATCKDTDALVKFSDKPLLLALIKNKIKGQAKYLIANRGDPDNLATLLSWLRTAFARTFDDEHGRDELRRLKQQENENVVAYGARVGEILSRALEAAKERYQPTEFIGVSVLLNQDAINGFTTGLRHSIFNAFLAQPKPITLNDAINIAAELEKNVASRNTLFGNNNNFYREPVKSYGRAKIHTITDNAIKCYGCAEPGHIKRNCPNLERQRADHHAQRRKTGDQNYYRDVRRDREHHDRRENRYNSNSHYHKSQQKQSLNAEDAQRKNATLGTGAVARSGPTGSITTLN